ncbi:DUF1932 domain-containing protein [Amycolatopsis sp. NBC_01488]|uniref:NAD(P)-dependent oxidoreductase n=1 Tax=Amycolatopsis sp. NBC_01488 TaxID=2903563 RepID=UPI002E2E645C|nr:DUF1932 domain-containing protein [Amycolatopsis sp. NBC_01488]
MTTTVGLLHPGAMGAAVGAVLAGRGVPVSWLPAGRGPATRRRAEAAGLTEARDLTGCDVVLSVCPPAAALDVARAVADSGFGGLYLDANAISPRHAAEIERILENATVADGGIVGPPPRASGTTRLYLSGPGSGVARLESLFDGTHLRPVALAGPVGKASALKLAFAAYNKLTFALAAQSHALAQRHGVGGELRELAADVLPGTPFGAPDGITAAAAKAWRWEGEMAEIAETCADTGLSPALVTAAGELFGRWRDHRDDDGVALGDLLQALVTPPE